MSDYYTRRRDECQAILDELIERSGHAIQAEFDRLVEQVTAAQREVNNWQREIGGTGTNCA